MLPQLKSIALPAIGSTRPSVTQRTTVNKLQRLKRWYKSTKLPPLMPLSTVEALF